MAEKETLEEDSFEDIDFEDLDSDDAFEDESWDDFDDSDDAATDVESDVGDENIPERAAAAPRKKGFVGKNFNLIVVGLAVLGGGGFFLSQFGSSSSQAPTSGEQAASFDADTLSQQPMDIAELNTDMPPMPAPMDATEMGAGEIESGAPNLAVSEDLDLGLQGTDTALAESEDLSATDLEAASDVLTPLPDSQDENELALADLDAFPDPAPAIDADANMDTDIDSLSFERPQDATMGANVVEPAVAVDSVDAGPITSEPDIFSEQVFSAQDTEGSLKNTVDTSQTQAVEQRVEDLNAALADKDMALENAKKTESKLFADLQNAQTQNMALTAQIESLKKKLEEAEARASSMASNSSKTPPQSTEANEEKPTASDETKTSQNASVGTDTPTAELTSHIAPKPVWTLKSARPGHATLSSKDLGDLRQVEVGQTIPGLGKILDISIQENRWVVRGSKASVSQ